MATSAFPTEVCTVCMVLYCPDPEQPKQCPVCETRSKTENLVGQLLGLIKLKRDKKKPTKQGRIIHPANGAFRR